MDVKGRVLLPMGIRYKLDLNEGDLLAVDQLGDGTIIIKKLARRLHTELEKRNIREEKPREENFQSIFCLINSVI
jgi:AbrB family looped-hinge helix DNA binding protein